MCNSEVHLKKLYWRSRRGLLELDLLLPPFLADCYRDLDAPLQSAYESLLSCEDPDILSWINGHTKSDDQHIQDIIERIRKWNSARSK